MQRRTFLTGTALAAAAAALPLSVPAFADTARRKPRRALGPTVDVSSLDDLQDAIDAAGPGTRIVLANGTYTVPSAKPLTITGKNGTRSAPITSMAGTRATPITRSLRNALRPAPAAKNENRQASWRSSPGSTTPRPAKAEIGRAHV